MKAFLFICLNLIIMNAFSQVGKDCANPFIITSLPYSASGLSTNGFGNDYTNPCPSCPSTNFMTGYDYVIQFTPLTDLNITIKLTNTTAPAASVGLFLVKGCPDQVNSQLVAKSEGIPPGSVNPEILNKTVLKDTTYYIIIDTYNFMNFNPYTAFDIEIYEAHVQDVRGIRFCEPKTGCELTTGERFVLLLKNIGVDTLYSIPVGYQVNNDPPVYESRDEIALPGNEYYYTFNTLYDLSAPNTTYMIKMFTALPGDGNLANDTLYFPVTNNTTITSLPYIQDFENGPAGWTTAWINHLEPGTSWELGSPVKTVINHAASGTKCWVTDTNGTSLINENSYVISPCFDLSSMTLPVLDLDIWYETETYDIAKIEYTTDRGFGSYVNWTALNTPGYGQNWYNSPSGYAESGWNGSSGGWKHAFHTLDTLGGKPYVIFRIKFVGGVNGVSEGFAFDNFRISESPLNDLAIERILYPENSCRLSATDSVKVMIVNHGLGSQTNFPVKCSVDGGVNFVTDTIHSTLNFLDTLKYTFIPSFDFSAPGLYNIIAATVLPGDQVASNDTLMKEVMNYPLISSFPMTEDFEMNNGYWYAEGLNSSWEWGIPADTVLTSAGSGSNCWATNLTGYHNLGERSYVTSPCIDIATMTKPKLKMMIWYDELLPSYCQFRISTDGGSTFGALGSASDPNWFNAGYSWTNTSGGWINVEHTLMSYLGSSDIRFQFYFEGGIQRTGFAFDKFTICDLPTASFTEDLTIKGYFVKFVNSSSNADSYLWDFGDGTFSNLAIPPDHAYPNSDSVLVTLHVFNTCGEDSIKKWVHPKFVGVSNADFDKYISLYPNPVNDNLHISVNAEMKEMTIEILDIQGAVLLRKQCAMNRESGLNISLKQLSKGIYFVRLTNDNGVFNRKLIKD